MKTLVTGATGFLGSHVARALVERGEEIRVLVRASSDVRALEGLNAERVQGDLRDRASLERAMQGVQRVFHVAADYRLWAKDPREIHESNVAGTQNLLDAARNAGVTKFVYTSTVATIAVPRDGDLPNETTRSCVGEMIGEYKRSKFEAEQCALRAAEVRGARGDRESHDTRGTRRLEADADGENHCRFFEWQDARLRGHRIEFRSGGRLRAGTSCWPPSVAASGNVTFWAVAI